MANEFQRHAAVISAREFGKLRMSDWFPVADIVGLENWKFGERVWIGEAIGFSEWLRPVERPDSTEYVSLDFTHLPVASLNRVIEHLGINIESGMSFPRVAEQFGEPIDVHVFGSDRKTFDYECGETDRFMLSLTMPEDGGLSYFGMMLDRREGTEMCFERSDP